MKYEREFWIYQRRDVSEPWALKVIKRVDTDKSPVMVFDIILYHVRAPSYGNSAFDLHPKHLTGFSGVVYDLCRDCGVAFNDQDAMQIDSAMLDIIADPRTYND